MSLDDAIARLQEQARSICATLAERDDKIAALEHEVEIHRVAHVAAVDRAEALAAKNRTAAARLREILTRDGLTLLCREALRDAISDVER